MSAPPRARMARGRKGHAFMSRRMWKLRWIFPNAGGDAAT